MIFLLDTLATKEQLAEMLAVNQLYIKVAVDINLGVLAGGGELHSDCERILLENGSHSSDIWGADWYPHNQIIEYESIINLKPRQNRSMHILDATIRECVAEIIRGLLELS